jgi:hypothetical protein
MEMEMEVEKQIPYEYVKLETGLTDYHYEQGRKLALSIKKLSRLPISFEEAREIANEQQVMLSESN